MILKTFREFRSSLQQLPAFEAIHPKDRRGFLSDAYKLAKERYEKEMRMETAHQAAKSSRPSTIKLLRAAKHIMNALKEIEKAKGAAPASPPELMRHLEVEDASRTLRTAYDDLGFLMAMDIAAVHPHHRTGFERLHRAIYHNGFLSMVEKRFSEVPARRSRFDYLLVAALNSRLDKCTTSSRPLRPIDRYRIISQVFLAALQQIYNVGTVKTALLRTLSQPPV